MSQDGGLSGAPLADAGLSGGMAPSTGGTGFITAVTPPLAVAAGNLSIPASDNSTDGYLTQFDHSDFADGAANASVAMTALNLRTPARWFTQSFSAVTTTGLIVLPANPLPAGSAVRYWEIVISGTGGMLASNPVAMQFNNDTGSNYLSLNGYGNGTLGSWSANGPGTNSRSTGIQLALTGSVANVLSFFCRAFFCPLKSRGPQMVEGRFVSKSSSGDATFISGISGGCYDQVANDITQFKVNFGGAFTGVVDVFGYV